MSALSALKLVCIGLIVWTLGVLAIRAIAETVKAAANWRRFVADCGSEITAHRVSAAHRAVREVLDEMRAEILAENARKVVPFPLNRPSSKNTGRD